MIEVRQATAADVAALVGRTDDAGQQQAEYERFDAQERGEGLLLVAWEGDALRGRVRLRFYSKYLEVLDEFGEFPEINALDAWPQGQGVGTRIVAECERLAAARGETQIGIGVLLTNVHARRLYERLGYLYWGDVIDDGEPAAYLVKKLP